MKNPVKVPFFQATLILVIWICVKLACYIYVWNINFCAIFNTWISPISKTTFIFGIYEAFIRKVKKVSGLLTKAIYFSDNLLMKTLECFILSPICLSAYLSYWKYLVLHDNIVKGKFDGPEAPGLFPFDLVLSVCFERN